MLEKKSTRIHSKQNAEKTKITTFVFKKDNIDLGTSLSKDIPGNCLDPLHVNLLGGLRVPNLQGSLVNHLGGLN